MVKSQLNIRIDSTKRERLIRLAQKRGVAYADLIRSKVDEILIETTPNEIKKNVKNVINELKSPFAYVKTETGIKKAKEERKRRNDLIKQLSNIYGVVND